MRTHSSLRTLALVSALLVTVDHAHPAAAQLSELSVEVGGSRVLPPAGVDGAAALFFVAGLRGSRYNLSGSGLYGSLLVGKALDSGTGGDFVSAEAGAAAWHPLSPAWAVGVEGRAFGFRVADPFPYVAGAAEGSAMLRYRSRLVRARLTGTGGVGRSEVTLTEVVRTMRREATVTSVLTDDLWRVGSTAEVLAGRETLAAGVAAGIHRSAGGTYRSAGVRLASGGQLGAVELRADVWRTPDGSETTGGIAFYVPWGGWSTRGVGGKPEPDPLLRAEPGRGAGGVLVGRRILGSRPPTLRDAVPLHDVVRASSDGARVRLTVQAPEGARTVEVLGDFTLWTPVPMSADKGRWMVEMDVPVGTHHFGFLVDGDWYLPDDAPDAVPDEWGRRSATLVIEGLRDPQGVGEP